MIKRYNVTGMTCSACSSGIERTIGRLEGVTLCEVSLMGKSLKVEFDEKTVTEEKIFETVKSLGYGISAKTRLSRPTKSKKAAISVCLLILLYPSACLCR